MRVKISAVMLAAVLAASFFISCSSQRKLSNLRRKPVAASIRLGSDREELPDLVRDDPVKRDTMKVKDLDGREVIIMKAIRDDSTGEMVATEELRAAVVTARFRNVAERRGEVDLEFQVIVTDSLRDSKWQLRFYPRMYILADTVDLDPVVITGLEFRKGQLRGYQLYERFLQSIANDSLHFVDTGQLEIFLERNLPQVFRFRNDTSFFSEEEFESVFGVTEREAVEHYSNKFLVAVNARKLGRKGKMFDRYVRNPIDVAGIRLDTVLRTDKGEFVYNYIQRIRTRPKLRKVDIVLSGEIRDSRAPVYDIPPSDPLTFYISSLSSFVDNTERFKTMILERRVEANTAINIDFESASSEVNPRLGSNEAGIASIESLLASLLDNKVFDLDSVKVTASCSPEGQYQYNSLLASRRSKSVSAYFGRYMRQYLDSLEAERGFSVDENGKILKGDRPEAIQMRTGKLPENWPELDLLVQQDTILDEREKAQYFELADRLNLDQREAAMKKLPFYPYLRLELYPKLRTVRFDFHLHRKGMVKDTVHTTVLDSVYMEGVQAIRDRDYLLAIKLLRPYNDFNTAVAYLAMDYNASALSILEKQPRTAKVNYMLAILHSRRGEDQKAVESYLHSCQQEPQYVHRGNLDPEIFALIRRYNLNAQ